MAHPPAPQGYLRVPIVISPGVEAIVLSCKKCGGLVLMHRTHTDWHKKNG